MAGSQNQGGGTTGGGAGVEVGATANTLYHLGRGGETAVYSVGVDSENIFWAGINVFQAPKAGGGTPVLIATSGAGVFVLRASAGHLYWIEQGTLKRIPKVGQDPSGATFEDFEYGGLSIRRRRGVEPEHITLPWSTAEDVLLDDTYAYVAMAGCAAIVRLNLTSLSAESLTPPTSPTPTTGFTYLAKQGSDLYCGAWQRVFRTSGWAALEELASSAARVAGITVVGDRLYWLDKLGSASGDSRGALWSWGAGTVPAKLGDVLMGTSGPTSLFGDASRPRLYWVDSAVMEFALEGASSRVWKTTTFTSGGSARDDTYLYWTRSAPSYATIERMRLDEP